MFGSKARAERRAQAEADRLGELADEYAQQAGEQPSSDRGPESGTETGSGELAYERWQEQQANTFRTPLDLVPDAEQPNDDRGPERPEMDQDYYTQPVGSVRHQDAHRAYFDAAHGGGAAFLDDPYLSYYADNAAELEYDRWQAGQEAAQADDEDGPGPEQPDPDQSAGPYGTFGHEMDTGQMLAGTREGDAEDEARMGQRAARPDFEAG